MAAGCGNAVGIHVAGFWCLCGFSPNWGAAVEHRHCGEDEHDEAEDEQSLEHCPAIGWKFIKVVGALRMKFWTEISGREVNTARDSNALVIEVVADRHDEIELITRRVGAGLCFDGDNQLLQR